MNCICIKRSITIAIVGLVAISGSIALAQTSKERKPAPPTAPAVGDKAPGQLPEGMTEADMQACMEAGTPGEMHAHLAKSIGVWNGKTKMWMAPDTEPQTSECVSTITPMMDGRFTKCEIKGEMPGMGPFDGFGIYGFDNVSQEFVSSWIDNCGTGIMNGKGELSSDGKIMTWNFTYNCPITKKQTVMREVERVTGKDTKVFEMYGQNPKTGKEFKMMEIAFTRKPTTTAGATMGR